MTAPSDSQVATTGSGNRAWEQFTPAYAAALGVAAVSVDFMPWLALAGAVVIAIVGRRRPWVVAAAVVVGSAALFRFLFLGLPFV